MLADIIADGQLALIGLRIGRIAINFLQEFIFGLGIEGLVEKHFGQFVYIMLIRKVCHGFRV